MNSRIESDSDFREPSGAVLRASLRNTPHITPKQHLNFKKTTSKPPTEQQRRSRTYRLSSFSNCESHLLRNRIPLSTAGFYHTDNYMLVCFSCDYDFVSINQYNYNEHRQMAQRSEKDCPVLARVGYSLSAYLRNPTGNPRLVDESDNSIKKPITIIESSSKESIKVDDEEFLQRQFDILHTKSDFENQIEEYLTSENAKFILTFGDYSLEALREMLLCELVTNGKLPKTKRETMAMVQSVHREPDTHKIVSELTWSSEVPMCLICLEEPVSRTFSLCGHLCACEECARRCPRCPLCRTAVAGTIHTKLPCD